MLLTNFKATANTFLQYRHSDVMLPRWFRQFNDMSGVRFLDILRVDAVDACHSAVRDHADKADHLGLVGFFQARADYLIESEGGSTYSQGIEFRVKRETPDVALEQVDQVYVRLDHEGTNVKKKYIGHHISGNDLIKLLHDPRAKALISGEFLAAIKETVSPGWEKTLAVYDKVIAAHHS